MPKDSSFKSYGSAFLTVKAISLQMNRKLLVNCEQNKGNSMAEKKERELSH